MRTNIDIDDQVLAAAMQSGAYKTKKDVVEAGLRLIARQAAYREILKWEGKLQWDADDLGSAEPQATSVLRTRSGVQSAAALQVQEPQMSTLQPALQPTPQPAPRRRHVGR